MSRGDFLFMEPKVAYLDIENSPLVSFNWGTYEQNAIRIIRQSYLLTFSWKWKDGEQITKGLSDYKLFKREPRNDKELARELRGLLDQADLVIAHNGLSHDIRKVNSRLLFHGFPPPSHYRVIDTLRAIRSVSSEGSNKLDSLGEHWNLGRKIEHEGFALWEKCMDGNKSAFERMKTYNAQDVLLLEKVYLKLRPWIKSHINLTNISEVSGCPTCGSRELQKRGFRYTQTQKYQQLACKQCKSWSYVPLDTKRDFKPVKN